MTGFLDELRWREQLHQTTADDDVARHLDTPGRRGYAGFDPTSDSLTIGNFIPMKLLMMFQQAGHQPIVLMGGGTGLIGDPSGKDAERTLITREEVEANVAAQRRIMERIIDFDPKRSNHAILVNNLDWLEKVGFLEMLRDVGKHFSINAMIQKDSVRDRLEQREQGISFTEFSYMILQAYDFLHLRRDMECTVQMAGSDQYGNIVCGIDLIRREFGHDKASSYGITAPLVTRSDGKKIGKTEKGAIYLSADRTSPYAFYQYWINVDDADVVKFLRWFTLLPKDEIQHIAERHETAPHERGAQRELAKWMTDCVHGPTEVDRAEQASRALFSGDVQGLDAALLSEVFADVAHTNHARTSLEGEGISLVDVLPGTSLAKSKREARQFLDGGAVSVNGRKVPSDYRLKTSDLLHDATILLRRGKKSWHATKWG